MSRIFSRHASCKVTFGCVSSNQSSVLFQTDIDEIQPRTHYYAGLLKSTWTKAQSIMKSLLVKIASVAVMFHMTFGCSMHHGIGTNACAHQHETECDHGADSTGHDEDHDHHEHQQHDHDQLPVSEPAFDVDDKNQSPGHDGCCDDGCTATQFVQFKFQAIDFSVPYLGGVDTLALIERQSYAGVDVVPFSDCLHSETGVRAHLLYGVQIL